MYTIDEQDAVRELDQVPAPETGAPLPLVVAREGEVRVAYAVANSENVVALLELSGALAHMFGAPNDEALHGHPLTARGLRSYGVYEVLDSSWIRALEVRNRVHDRHDPASFARFRHFILTFHDSTFECVAADLRVLITGSWSEVAKELGEALGVPVRAT